MRLRPSIRYRPGVRGTWMERPSTGLPGASPPGALRLDDLPQGGPAPGPVAWRCPFRRITAAREAGALVQYYSERDRAWVFAFWSWVAPGKLGRAWCGP